MELICKTSATKNPFNRHYVISEESYLRLEDSGAMATVCVHQSILPDHIQAFHS